MESASGTLVSSKDRHDPSYAISDQLGNAGQTRVATRGRVSMRGIRARILPRRLPQSRPRPCARGKSPSCCFPEVSIRGNLARVESAIVGPEESNARNSEPMFLNPLPHLLTRPCPFEWMGVQPIVLRPGLPHVIDELGSTVPRSSLQVVVTECADQQLRFVEPRGVDRGEATSPPAGASRQVVPRLCGRMGRVVIVDQIDSAR